MDALTKGYFTNVIGWGFYKMNKLKNSGIGFEKGQKNQKKSGRFLYK